MKQFNSLYNSNAEELLGRVTLSGKNIFNRSAYILVTNEQNTPKGYKAIISAHDLSANTSMPYINSSLKFEIKAKQFYAASQRVL